MNLWWEHMCRGDFAEAWQVSDAILQQRQGVPCWRLPRHQQYIWDGRPIDGARVLVRCYHGLGDTIQFARYAPLLRSRAREVIFWAQSALIPLLQTVAGIDRILPLHDGTPDVDYDVDVELMELPHIFRTTLDTIPREVPYLQASPAVLPPSSRLRAGIFWRVGDWDDRRAIPYALLPRLLAPAETGDRAPRVELCMVARDHDAVAGGVPVTRLPGDDDVSGTARLMRALDLVITADSMPAHLAGALGVPVWTLLQTEPDWRWMRGRRDTPWYPTMRLFRQETAGDWAGVIERVAQELRALRLRAIR
jgi:hypothetical protein